MRGLLAVAVLPLSRAAKAANRAEQRGIGCVLKSEQQQGLAIALAGFTLLASGDVVVKTIGGNWPPTAIAATRYALGALGLTAALLLREGPAALRHVPRPGIQLLRGLAVATATLSFFASLQVLPLATAVALTFTSPMITALLAAVILGEPARRQTWIASLGAFAGVLVVLRPSLAAAGWAAVLPLLSALAMSILIICNRLVAGRATALAMQAYVAAIGAVLLIAATAVLAWIVPATFAVTWPGWSVLARCAVVACTATAAHWCIYLGTTRAGAATVAPMTYVQIVIAASAGWAVFGHRPDALTLLGAAIIIAAGLYLWRSNYSAGSAVPVQAG